MTLENSLTSHFAQAPQSPRFGVWQRVTLMTLVNVALVAAIALPILAYVAPPGPHTPWYAWVIAFTLQPLFVVQAILFTRWVDRRPLTDLPVGFDGLARQTALWGVLLTVGLMAAFIGLTQATGITSWSWNTAYAPAATFLAALLAASAGLGEEFLFRGYLLRTLSKYGPRAAAILSSVVFALMHMIVGRFNPFDLVALFTHGILFAILTQRSKSLWPAVIIHAAYNFLTSVVWSGSETTALLAFDGSIVAAKWLFKASMVIPYLAMVWWICRKRARSGKNV